MGLCISHFRTGKLIDKLGIDFDKEVHEWKDSIKTLVFQV